MPNENKYGDGYYAMPPSALTHEQVIEKKKSLIQYCCEHRRKLGSALRDLGRLLDDIAYGRHTKSELELTDNLHEQLIEIYRANLRVRKMLTQIRIRYQELCAENENISWYQRRKGLREMAHKLKVEIECVRLLYAEVYEECEIDQAFLEKLLTS
jgi:hypothetical protein